MNSTAVATVLLSVPDISCAHCARTIETALAPIAGVRNVVVEIPSKSVRVHYDADRDIVSQLGEILAEEGYPVASIERG